MQILAIDTSSKIFCLALLKEGRIYECNLEIGRKLSTLLSVIIKRSLDAAKIRLKDLDYLACGIGPGSFTGIRTGVAAVKGIGFALNKPIVGISSLDILAQNFDRDEGIVFPIIDARRGLVYCSAYEAKKGSLKRIMPYLLISRDELFKRAKAGSIFLGDAVALYKDEIMHRLKGAIVLDKDYWFPRGSHIITLALKKIGEKKITNAFDIQPLYLYPKECQIKEAIR
jgi:tRNA threonylcarbamoyladenosine biosynthesis protein TsaB